MQSKLLVTSKSNISNLKMAQLFRFDDSYLVYGPPNKTQFKQHRGIVIALGGGSVIDTAKLISKGKPIIAIPTTASGASCTSWAVVWEKKEKVSVKCKLPMLCEFYRHLDLNMSAKVALETYYDCFAHIMDSRNSKNRTRESMSLCDVAESYLKYYLKTKKYYYLIDAGNFAGKAIQITGTNRLHALSYVLTLDYGLSHGEALKEVIEMNTKWDWNKIVKKARKYEKFHEII